ncbi:hypothetical protein [Luteimicrobium subarcticum]|uniref:Uncharacterized protein n=1 Tax=Luteimicrobium subarcticum TaxID=620910 RepID=A0A2M8WV61_9MICO|nr:hypothetical protein [Luteimicrobium subarcticum]PJI94817.1 hypothetical protein CLV34_0665 [Luteimicrobium subarcticum]
MSQHVEEGTRSLVREHRGTEASSPRSVRCDDGLWAAVKARAEADGVTINYAVGVLLEGYASDAVRLELPPPTDDPAVTGGTRSSVSSLRVADTVWAAAKARAAGEGLTMNAVVNRILGGYHDGLLRLPTVVLYFAPTGRPSEA